MLLKSKFNKGNKILVTQPRRIAVTTLSRRISQELKNDELVAYKVIVYISKIGPKQFI